MKHSNSFANDEEGKNCQNQELTPLPPPSKVMRLAFNLEGRLIAHARQLCTPGSLRGIAVIVVDREIQWTARWTAPIGRMPGKHVE